MAGDDLKDRVVDFATDILKMWRNVAAQPAMSSFSEITASDAAVAEAASSATWFGLAPVFQ